MESVQISPCAFICEREESSCLQISGWKCGHFETSTTKTNILTFLENKRLFARTTYIRLLIYLKAIYGRKMKEIDFSTLATRWSIFLTVALKTFRGITFSRFDRNDRNFLHHLCGLPVPARHPAFERKHSVLSIQPKRPGLNFRQLPGASEWRSKSSKNRATSRGIPKFSKISSRKFPFHDFNFAPWKSWIWMVHISGDFCTICRRFWIFESFGWMKSAHKFTCTGIL